MIGTHQFEEFTIIFTEQDNTTVELTIAASDRLDAAKQAALIASSSNCKDWQFADAHPIGTL